MSRHRVRVPPLNSSVTVTAECIGCGHRRQINAGEVAPDDMPMCDRCHMPMIAKRAQKEHKP